jgi:hypothetical protein
VLYALHYSFGTNLDSDDEERLNLAERTGRSPLTAVGVGTAESAREETELPRRAAICHRPTPKGTILARNFPKCGLTVSRSNGLEFIPVVNGWGADSVIELAVVKSVVDLFKELLSFIDRAEKNRREMFDRTFKPLYERMEAVAKEYHSALAGAALALQAPEPDLQSILKEFEQKRAELIIARNGVVGESKTFQNEFKYPWDEERLLDKKGRQQKLAFQFVKSITDYFEVAHDQTFEGELWPHPDELTSVFTDQGWSVSKRSPSMHTALADDIRLCLRLRERLPQEVWDEDLNHLRECSKRLSNLLEERWSELSMRFTELRLYCGA